jgi:hypothetical protein
MKTFVNKETEFTLGEKKLGYADLAKFCLDNPPKEGWAPADMKMSIKVEAKLEDKEFGAKIKLEDAEFDYLHKRSQPDQMRWAIKHAAIVDFTDYLESLKKKE